MGALDEILKQFQSWIKPIINNIQALHVVVNSGFDTKIRQEASGFSNIWSGLDEIRDEVIQLQGINNSGFDTKIRQEASGFGNLWSGATLLRTINRSGLQGVWTRLDTKIVEERSGFRNTWSGLQDIAGVNTSGFQRVDASIQLLQTVNRSGFNDIQSGVIMLRQGETVALSTGGSIAGTVSGQLGCYDRWTLYTNASGAINITLELTPNPTPPYYWFEPSESPIAVASGGFSVLEMGYDAVFIRLTGSNPSGVTSFIRGCW